jgi:ABC-type uncharacterized transport system permease subunit
MSAPLIIELATLAILIAATATAWLSPAAASDKAFKLAGAALLASIGALVMELGASGWHADLASTLKVTVLATLFAYVAIGSFSQRVQQLGVLVLPYSVLFGVFALIVGMLAAAPTVEPVASVAWYDAHIVFALATYGLLTLAAMAGLACLIQEAALKRKATGRLSARLPAVAESEQAEIRLLAGAEIVLGVGIATGMALAWLDERDALPLDHKSVLAVAAFLVIGGLLLAHARFGYRGRRAARWVMIAWLLVTLAYPGVKFVREILLS